MMSRVFVCTEGSCLPFELLPTGYVIFMKNLVLEWDYMFWVEYICFVQ